MVKCRLSCLASNHNALVEPIEGFATRLPILNDCFTIVFGNFAYYRTTKILVIHSLGNVHTFKTRNSEYKLELLS